jgi:hypothetical protein
MAQSRRVTRLLVVGMAAALSMAQSVAIAEDFAADLVLVGADGQQRFGRLSVADDRVHLETPEVAGGFFLRSGDTASFVKPSQRTYMDAMQSSELAQILLVVGTEAPCEHWQAAAKLSGAANAGGVWRCDRIGEEKIGERDTVLYTAVSPRSRGYAIWIDQKLGIPLRLRKEDGTEARLERIEVKPQPPDLFVVPRNYVKFDPLKLIERIKKSDVWVEPPQ